MVKHLRTKPRNLQTRRRSRLDLSCKLRRNPFQKTRVSSRYGENRNKAAVLGHLIVDNNKYIKMKKKLQTLLGGVECRIIPGFFVAGRRWELRETDRQDRRWEKQRSNTEERSRRRTQCSTRPKSQSTEVGERNKSKNNICHFNSVENKLYHPSLSQYFSIATLVRVFDTLGLHGLIGAGVR